MPRGWEGVRNVSAEVEARRNSGGPSALWFRLNNNHEAIVRFLEQDDEIYWCMVHQVPVEGRAWGKDVVCLDQEKDGTPCPGCDRDLPRRFKGFINLIWFDAPVFKRDSDNKIVKDRLGDPVVTGTSPQVALWSSGIRLFEELDEVNANFRGLMSRRFKIKRKGEKLDTKYHIAPEDVDSGPQAMTDDEKKLAEGKYDLNAFTTPGSVEDFLKALGEGGGSSNGGGGASTPAAEAAERNPFLRGK